MMVRLRHPIHGFMDTNSAVEAKYARENGWEDVPPAVVEAPAPLPSFLGGGEYDIPESFPARKELIEGGLTKWADLVTKTELELIAIKGIGPATAREILEKLNS